MNCEVRVLIIYINKVKQLTVTGNLRRTRMVKVYLGSVEMKDVLPHFI